MESNLNDMSKDELRHPRVSKTFGQKFAIWVLARFGWKVVDNYPPSNKYIIISANHTSNWDFPLALFLGWALDLRLNWIGKKALFRWPFTGIMKGLGGIPVDRKASTNFVDQIIEKFNESKELRIAIAPDGTRSNAEYWKTGFYYIAQGAKIPISFAILDYKRKEGGLGHFIMPSGDLEADIKIIHDYYENIKGRYPEKQGEVKILPRAKENEATS